MGRHWDYTWFPLGSAVLDLQMLGPADAWGRKTKQGAYIGADLRAPEQHLTDEKLSLRAVM